MTGRATAKASNGLSANSLLFGLTLLIVVVLGVLYWTNSTLVTRQTYTGFEKAVRLNTLYGLEQVLMKLRMPVRSVGRVSELTEQVASDDVVVMSASGAYLAQEQSDRLLAWVAKGGHLMMSASAGYRNAEGEQTNPFFEELGIQLHVADQDIDTEDVSEVLAFFGLNLDFFMAAQNATIVKGASATDVYEVTFMPKYTLTYAYDDQTAWSANSDDGEHIVQFQYGDGLVTVFSDIGFLQNRFLPLHDHASFFMRLLDVDNINGNVWLQFTSDMPSWIDLLWHFAWMVLLTFALFLFLAIWSASQRFGPLLPVSSDQRRELREHLHAAGRLAWQRGAADLLIETMQQRLLARLERTHPATVHMPNLEKYRYLAHLVGVPVEDIERVFAQPVAEQEKLFIQNLKLLTRLGNIL